MGNLKFKVNDRVRVKDLEWYNENKTESGYMLAGDIPFVEEMTIYCNQVLTISEICGNGYHTRETECRFYWTDDMFEGLVESELNEPQDNEQSFKAVDDVDYVKPVVFENIVFPNENYADKVELCLGDDYEIVVEDGRTFVQRKKPKYPTTYEECRKVLGIDGEMIVQGGWYKHGLIHDFYKLLICRDAYWEIADNWKPNLGENFIYAIGVCYDDVEKVMVAGGRGILLFPTEEMRDAFYENFKCLIEDCKELL